MSQWKHLSPISGNQIRVKRPYFYHHGIYIGNGRIIHFAVIDKETERDPYKAVVHECDIASFLRGGELEVRVYDKDELQYVRKADDVMKLARCSIGEKGYDLIKNNCEDFSNRCAYVKAPRTQLDDYRDRIKELLSKK